VGLQGNWRQFIVGQWDSPYKVSTSRIDPTGNTGIGAYTGILGGTGSITAGQGGTSFSQRASFDRRISNVVQYWTPSWSGLSARFAYGATDSSLGSASTGVAESSGLRPQLFAGMAAYEAGPFHAALAYERHDDFQSLNTLLAAPASAGKDQAWYLVAKYETGAHNVALSYGFKGEEKLSGAGFSDLPDSKANQVTARYAYSLSKRTQLYAIATRITNEPNAFQTFGNAAITPTSVFLDPARGADPSGFGLGMIHSF
jgi:predicted porin